MPRNVWEKHELQFLTDNAGKIEVAQIAKELGRTVSAVKVRATYMMLSLKVRSQQHTKSISNSEVEDLLNKVFSL